MEIRARFFTPLLFIVLIVTTKPATAAPIQGAGQQPAWQPWSAAVFEQAKRENKLILLNLEAVWCHWCHVMDQKTYADAKVNAYLAKHYISVKVDHDANPALANRYRAYGWPATIFLSADGTDIVKRAGYISPGAFLRLLTAIVADPSPENTSPTGINGSSPRLADPGDDPLSAAQREYLGEQHRQAAAANGGLDIAMKFLDRDSVEYSLFLGTRGELPEQRRALTTLDAALALEDPVWGGFYQYSTGGDWQHPHFEKIMRTQTRYLSVYALAWRLTGDARYQQAAGRTHRYLNRFLRGDNGAYFVSQDADLIQGQKAADYFALGDNERMALGIPRIDRNQYSRENAQVAIALQGLYRATGNRQALDDARRAAHWILNNRQRDGGGFRHDTEDGPGQPFLADTLYPAIAFLRLYQATAERQWLHHAIAATDFIRRQFATDSGALTASIQAGVPLQPTRDLEENIELTRHAILLAHYSGHSRFRALAKSGLTFLASYSEQQPLLTEPGILLAADEYERDPTHVVIVGSKQNEQAQKLFSASLALPAEYFRLEWFDRSEGPLYHHDIEYPQLDKPAAFVCTNGRCSVPLFNAAQLRDVAALLGPAL